MQVNREEKQTVEPNPTRDRILQAASQLFLEGGVAALSVRAIAKRAGLSTIGIYSHFNGKQGILDTLYIEGFEKVYAAMDISGVSGGRREKALHATREYWQVAENFGAHYRLIFGESDAAYTPSDAAVQASEKAFKRLVDLAALFLPNSAGAKQRQKLALEIWAIVHGYVSLAHHSVAEALDINDWRSLAVSAVATHIDALELPPSAVD